MGSRLLYFLAGAALAFAILKGCARVAPPRVPATPEPAQTPTPTPVPTPTPPPYVPNKRIDVGKIFNGLQFKAEFETEVGTHASLDRLEPSAYSVDIKLKVKVPKPYKDLESLSKLNPDLAAALPSLSTLLESAKISTLFDDLYRLKTNSVQQGLRRLDSILTRHNFFDCETILELQHPSTKRRALLMQADMDTDTDGSDSDRVPNVDGSSVTFQPTTSYRWAKRTAQPSSFIAPREAKLKLWAAELAAGTASPARQKELKAASAELKAEISDLRKYSFLVAADDPYVVLPGAMFAARNRGSFSPSVGDLCVVIYGKTLYPAIVGDVGPMSVVGEASLRLCKQIDPRANADNRPVDDLKVTYLLFPGTAEKPFGVPDYDKWHARCETLLQELGGHGGELHAWEDLLKPPATPAPTPAPPVPTPTPVPKTTPAPVLLNAAPSAPSKP